MLFVAERARPVAVQVEGAEADRPHLQRKAEDGPYARVDGGGGEAEPAGRGGVGQVGFEHRPVLVVGVDARPSPSEYCNCSIRALTSSVVHSEPRAKSPDISMIPAPLTR